MEWSRRSFALASVLAGLAVGAVPAARATDVPAAVATPSPLCTPRTQPIPTAPASLVSDTVVAGSAGRLHHLVLHSPAMGADEVVNVLLPPGYDPRGSVRYPVLYLLHGSAQNAQSWVQQSADKPGGPNPGIQQLIDQDTRAEHLAPFITVIPEGGIFGWYTDWYGADVTGNTPSPVPAWATFHIGELLPWIDAHYRTIPDRQHRAIAGLSMGGFGAMSYAARYPDLFGSAASFSGVVDTDANYPGTGTLVGELLSPVISGSLFYGGSQLPYNCIWGDQITSDVRWRGDNPTYLATNLSHTSLFIAYGNGQPGPYDNLSTPAGQQQYASGLVEVGESIDAAGLVAILRSNNIPFTLYDYGPGSHTFPYFLRDLTKFLPQMNAQFTQQPHPENGPFTFRTTKTTFSRGGWQFTAHHPALEFTYLRNVSQTGLTAIGSGTVDVVSAPAYLSDHRYRVTVATSGPGVAKRTSTIVSADSRRRIGFPVDLGPAHTTQQYVFGADTTAYPIDETPPGSPPQQLYAMDTPPGWAQAVVTVQPIG